jgi:hypothetical protein
MKRRLYGFFLTSNGKILLSTFSKHNTKVLRKGSEQVGEVVSISDNFCIVEFEKFGRIHQKIVALNQISLISDDDTEEKNSKNETSLFPLLPITNVSIPETPDGSVKSSESSTSIDQIFSQRISQRFSSRTQQQLLTDPAPPAQPSSEHFSEANSHPFTRSYQQRFSSRTPPTNAERFFNAESQQQLLTDPAPPAQPSSEHFSEANSHWTSGFLKFICYLFFFVFVIFFSTGVWYKFFLLNETFEQCLERKKLMLSQFLLKYFGFNNCSLITRSPWDVSVFLSNTEKIIFYSFLF